MFLKRASAICFALLFLAGVATAKKKTFNVVSFGKKVQVSVNGNTPVNMDPLFENQPLYSATMNVESDSIKYRYIEDGEEEKFKRRFPAGASATFNDFYGRKDTIKKLPQLPRPFKGQKNGQWTRGMGQVNPFNETYIPTVHFTGSSAKTFFTSPGEPKPAEDFSVFFILQDETRLFKGARMTAYQTRQPKLAIRMTLGGNDEFYGRNVLKFRFGENDPTFMREKLYTDLLVAVGAPVHQTGLVRVYVNGIAVGLYILQDESSDENFIRTEFYAKGKAPSKMGYPIDADTGGDFYWTDGRKWDSFKAHARNRGHHNYRKDATNARVVELSRALHKLNPANETAVAEFDQNWFDIDTFFKAMVFEYALGHWDSYWGLTCNFALYDDPNESDPPKNYKFYFLDEDFEYTFGSCLITKHNEFNQYRKEFTKQSYKTLLNRTWGKYKGPKHRTMIDKLLSSPALTRRFESMLIAIVKHLLNPADFFVRLDALAERYRREVTWDRTIKRLRKGVKARNWTTKDFQYGIDGFPGDVSKNCVAWGLKPYIRQRADAVAKEFNFKIRREIRSTKLHS